MNDEVFKLISRYKRKYNLNYNTIEIEELEAQKMLGSVNKYTFSQHEEINCYKFRLDHLWSLLMGTAYEDLEDACDLLQGAIDVKVERVRDIDAHNALIRYGDNLMLVNFRVEKSRAKGGKSEYKESKEVLISIFEFDRKFNTISPSNFIIISSAIASKNQRLSISSHGEWKDRQGAVSSLEELACSAMDDTQSKPVLSHAEEYLRSGRLLSAVAEDAEEDNGSMVIRKNPLRHLLSEMHIQNEPKTDNTNF